MNRQKQESHRLARRHMKRWTWIDARRRPGHNGNIHTTFDLIIQRPMLAALAGPNGVTIIRGE